MNWQRTNIVYIQWSADRENTPEYLQPVKPLSTKQVRNIAQKLQKQ